MNKIIIAVGTVLFAGSACANEPAGQPQEENSPEVVAMYKTQCNQWADQNDLKGDERDAYFADCMKDMPAILPVGVEKDD